MITQQRLFLILLLAIVICLGGWYLFVDRVKASDVTRLDSELQRVKSDVHRAETSLARLAGMDSTIIVEEQHLRRIRRGLVPLSGLTAFADDLRDQARRYSVEVIDVNPYLQDYLEVAEEASVKPMKVDIIVEGRFLDVARYVESWKDAQTVIVPDSMAFIRLQDPAGRVEGRVSGEIYTVKDR